VDGGGADARRGGGGGQVIEALKLRRLLKPARTHRAAMAPRAGGDKAPRAGVVRSVLSAVGIKPPEPHAGGGSAPRKAQGGGCEERRSSAESHVGAPAQQPAAPSAGLGRGLGSPRWRGCDATAN
jgi:hypothetical protein